jgi:hypothetical protein
LTSPSDEINDNYYEDDINEVIFSSEKKKLASFTFPKKINYKYFKKINNEDLKKFNYYKCYIKKNKENNSIRAISRLWECILINIKFILDLMNVNNFII